MEDSLLAIIALCGFLFSQSASLSIRNPYVLQKTNQHSPSNYQRTNWQNNILYDSSELTEPQSHNSKGLTDHDDDDDDVLLPESLIELRRWWSSVAKQQRGMYPDPQQVPDLGASNPNLEEDFSDTPQDYNYFYGSDPYSETISSDEAFRQALKAYILPGNPYLRSETNEDDADRTLNGNLVPHIQAISPNNDREALQDFFYRSYPHNIANEIKDNESKKQNFRVDFPHQTFTFPTSVPLPPTEATSQTPVSAVPSALPSSSSTPISKSKGQKEFAMLRPPSDNVRKFDQWAKSAQDFMKSVASAAVRETREARPAAVQPSKPEDTLSQQLSSLKRRSKRHTPKKFRDETMWYY